MIVSEWGETTVATVKKDTQVRYRGGVKSPVLTELKKKDEVTVTNIKKDYTINMVWHNVTNSTANSTVLEKIAATKGLTTIAPTWYHVKDTEGNLESISSAEYVNYAHQSNIEVWATVRDFDGGISSNEESLALLSSTSNLSLIHI